MHTQLLSTCSSYKINTHFSAYRLFRNLTMETIIAAAFGQRVEVQKGESSVLVKPASEMLYSFQDNGGLGLEGYSIYAPV